MTGTPPPLSAQFEAEKSDGKITLHDGTRLEGYSFGFRKPIAGEVVFNTAMSGYPESLTDPSYSGQILVLTYPLIGNYGVPPKIKEHQMLKFFESDRIHISGLIISEYSQEPSHWNAWDKLSNWLIENQIPGLVGIDTRMLTKKLRENGSMLGKLEFEGQEVDFFDPNTQNLVAKVSTKEVITYGSGATRVVLVDCGVKFNIIRKLIERNITVVRVPWDYDFTNLEYDGLFISNGPGDPKQCKPSIAHLAKAMEQDKPIFGICLGNQLMALAAGGDTYKLKYGHRSHNQPVLLKGTSRCFITSQNHGYATSMESLPECWEELFVNINDQTNEGLRHKTKPFFSTQFHPEASSGPTDTDFLFDEFISMIEGKTAVFKSK
jgi:carbamoyl-phosphate synthase small subunit